MVYITIIYKFKFRSDFLVQIPTSQILRLRSHYQSVANVVAATCKVTMSQLRDNLSIKTQKYTHFQRLRHVISAAFGKKATH